jgi:hypothetical protein
MPNADIRLFNCARCHCQVKICRYCDRGNIYCGRSCSILARIESVRAAGKRYQCSLKGRMNHALRQRRYRSRSNKVTHQGSTGFPSDDLLPLVSRLECTASGHESSIDTHVIQCGFCQRWFGEFIRMDFLHSYAPRHTQPPWIRSPPDS